MIRLNNDYCFGAHENILKALCELNNEANPGYGRDDYAYVVRYNNTDNEFTDLTFVTAEFEGNNIVLSSESFDGVKTSVKLMFEDGKYIN